MTGESPQGGVAGTAEEELAFAGVAGLLERLDSGAVTSRALVELFLRRIERLNPVLSAFTVVLGAQAQAAADEADALRAAGGPRPPLLGLPVAVKDNLDVAGVATGYGTRSPEVPALFDSEVVRRLRGAGCVILGKTTMPELALWPFGPARNPWDPTRTSGGSSSGSAAAVAAGLAPVATASDGGGSIRIPAAYSGLVGLKPTPGLVPSGPGGAHWYGLSAAGFVTRSVTDTALVVDAVQAVTDEVTLLDVDGPPASGAFAAAVARPTGSLRIGLTRHGVSAPKPVPLHPELFGALDDTAGLLAGLGHAVGPVDPEIGYAQGAFVPLYLRGARDDAVRLVDPGVLAPATRLVVRGGRLVGDQQVAAALRRGDRLRDRLVRLFGGIDVLLSPTVPSPAGDHDALHRARPLGTVLAGGEQTGYTSPWNIVGFPAVSVPAGLSRAGLPLSVQLVGAPGTEVRLLRLAAQLEREYDWTTARPPGIGSPRDVSTR